jgi:flagellar biogenesis protein FliO
MFELFGPDMPLAAKFFIAFAVVLALIGLTAWLVRRFGSNRLGGNARGRQPRLAVIDAATVDGRRRLVLIRRDNVEHLLMIGGPTDVVVEPNIVRATAGREIAREPAPRQTQTVESSWPLQPSNEPTPLPAPRPYRSSATEEPWLAPEPGARPRPTENLTGLAAELSTRLSSPEPSAPIARSEPRPAVAPVVPPPVASPPEPVAPAQTDHNLAEMAQQLEAALRRTPMPDSRPPVTDPLVATLAKPAPARDFKPRVEPKFDPTPRNETKFESAAETKSEPKFEPAAAPAKAPLDNLEEEMASLLGRPPGKT